MGTKKVFDDKNIIVFSTENTHFSFHSGVNAGRYKSYSYRIETSDHVIDFTEDTGWNKSVTKLLDGVDILITETSSCDERKNRMVGDGTWKKNDR